MRAVAPSAVSSARLAAPAFGRRAPRVALRRVPVPRAAVARLSEGAGASADASASLPGTTLSDSGTLVHGVLPGDARSLLPPERTSVGAREPARVADVSRYWAMPNLRPMKESSEGFLTFLKVSSFCILSVTFGVVVSHDAASRREGRTTRSTGRSDKCAPVRLAMKAIATATATRLGDERARGVRVG